MRALCAATAIPVCLLATLVPDLIAMPGDIYVNASHTGPFEGTSINPYKGITLSLSPSLVQSQWDSCGSMG